MLRKSEENVRSKQSKDSKLLLIEDLGDSDSSTTPLIPLKTISRVPDSGSLIEMERLPQAKSLNSKKTSDEEEVGDKSLELKDNPELTKSTTQEKKMLSTREKFFENKSPLERTASTPSSRVRHHDIPHTHPFLSPVREFKTLNSYEKAGKIYFLLLELPICIVSIYDTNLTTSNLKFRTNFVRGVGQQS